MKVKIVGKRKLAPLNQVEKKQVNKIVKRTLVRKGDLKYRDISSPNTNISSLGTVLYLTSPIGVGNGPSEREGNQVNAKRLELRMTIEGGFGQQGYATVRAMLVRDNQSTYGGIPTWLQIMESLQPESPMLYTAVKSKRYKVIFDRLLEIAPNQSILPAAGTGTVALSGARVAYNYQIKKKLDHEILWDSSSVSGKGHYYLVLISDLGTGGTTNPVVTAFSRLYYTD